MLASVERFLNDRLRLKVNRDKSAVDRPWNRKFLGYTFTTHFQPKLKVGEAHLNHLVAEYVEHFETERPHQGLHNKLVVAAKPPNDNVPALGQLQCRERLGGLLKHYERRAA